MLKTNQIIENQFIIENRLKKSIIEYNYLKNKLLENNYINFKFKTILNKISIDSDLIKYPLYTIIIFETAFKKEL